MVDRAFGSRFVVTASLLAVLTACGPDVGSLFSAPIEAQGGMSGAPSSGGSGDGDAAGSSNVAGSESGSAGSSGGEESSAGVSGSLGSGGLAQGGSNAGGSAGTVSVAGAGGAPPPSACDGKLVVAPATISTFESGLTGWSAYVDDNPVGLDLSQPGASSTERALRFQGGSAKTSGVYHLLPCSNVSDFDGIEFWGKGKGKGDAVRFLAVIPATDPTPSVGDCREPEQKCSDHPGMLFSFSGQWQLYRAPFAQLKQYGWGTKATFASVLNAVLWINDGPVEDFELWIDEVRLYKATAAR